MIAYPAITIISRETSGATRVAGRPAVDQASLATLAQALLASALPKNFGPGREQAQVTNGAEPWLLEASEPMALIRRLEKKFPSLVAW